MLRYSELDGTLFGHLSGHLVPGTLFILFGIWWLFNLIVHPVLSEESIGRPNRGNSSVIYRARVWHEVNGNCTRRCRVPVEPALKILLTAIGILGEMFGAHWTLYNGDDFEMESINNFSHATMFAFFGLSGFVDLVQYLKPCTLPKPAGFTALSMAFFIEGLLFYFHLDHERIPLDKQAHILLYTSSFICGLVVSLESRFPSSYILGLARPYFTILQGSWFYQIAFMLYGPTAWKRSSSAAFMLIPVVFAWHAFIILFLFIICLIFQRRIRAICLWHHPETTVGNEDFVSMERLLPGKEDDEEPNSNTQTALVQL